MSKTCVHKVSTYTLLFPNIVEPMIVSTDTSYTYGYMDNCTVYGEGSGATGLRGSRRRGGGLALVWL